jgi:cell wall assembly regulator SMI1
VNDLMDRLYAWYAGPSGEFPNDSPPASEGELREAERRLGVRLPEDLRAAYGLRNPFWLPTLDETLDLRGVVEVWEHYCGESTRDAWPGGSTPEGPVKADWWNTRWVPITENQGSCYFVDMDPDPSGQVGQVARYAVEGPLVTHAAPRFREWVEQLLADFDRVERFLADPERRGFLERLSPAELPREFLAGYPTILTGYPSEGAEFLARFQSDARSYEAAAAQGRGGRQLLERFPGYLSRFRQLTEFLFAVGEAGGG